MTSRCTLAAVLILLLGTLSPAAVPTSAPALTAKLREPDKTIHLHPKARIHSLAIAPDGRSAYVSATLPDPTAKDDPSPRDLLLKLDLETSRIARVLSTTRPSDRDYPERMMLAPDGASLLMYEDTSFRESGLCQIGTSTGRLIRELPPRWGGVSNSGFQPAFAPDGRMVYLASAGDEYSVLALDLSGNRQSARLKLGKLSPDERYHAVQLFAQGNSVLIAESLSGDSGYDIRMSIWNPAENKVLRSFTVPNMHLGYCHIEPAPICATATRLYAVTGDVGDDHPVIEVWDTQTGTRQQTIASPRNLPIRRVWATPDDRLLLGGADRHHEPLLAIYDTQAGRWIDLLNTSAFGIGYESPVSHLNLSPDGRILVAVHAADPDNPGESEQYLALFDLARFTHAR